MLDVIRDTRNEILSMILHVVIVSGVALAPMDSAYLADTGIQAYQVLFGAILTTATLLDFAAIVCIAARRYGLAATLAAISGLVTLPAGLLPLGVAAVRLRARETPSSMSNSYFVRLIAATLIGIAIAVLIDNWK